MSSEKYLDSLIWAAIHESNCGFGVDKIANELKMFEAINQILGRNHDNRSDSRVINSSVIKDLNDMYKNYYFLSQNGEFSVRTGRYSSDFEPVNTEQNVNSTIGYIGEGSFGKVFKVKHKIDHQLYAIKQIDLKDKSEEQRKKILREVKIWSKLQNRFIVEYKSSWIEEVNTSNNSGKIPVLFIQMALCHISLKEAVEKIDDQLELSKGLLPFGVLLVSELFLEIIKGVDYLHRQIDPIIHRDLNLDNILFVESNDYSFIKICDFGISILHENKCDRLHVSYEEPSLSKHTGDVGNIEFAAPEVLDGKDYDTQSDMYSLGVILSKLLCLPKELIFSIHTNFEFEDQEKKNELRRKYSAFLESEYIPIFKLMMDLLSDIPQNRPSCSKILLSKDKYLLSFEGLKHDYSMRYLFYQLFIREYSQMPLSFKVLQIKIELEIENQFHLFKNSETTRELFEQDLEEILMGFRFLRLIKYSSTKIDTNIDDGDCIKEIIRVITHSFYLSYELNKIEVYIEEEMEKLFGLKWKCFTFYRPNHCNWYHINWSNCKYFSIAYLVESEDNSLHTTARVTLVEVKFNSTYDTESKIVTPVSTSIKSEYRKKIISSMNQILDKKISESEISLSIESLFEAEFKQISWKCYITKLEYFQHFSSEHQVLQIYAFKFRQLSILVLSKALKPLPKLECYPKDNYEVLECYEDASLSSMNGIEKLIIENVSKCHYLFYENCYHLKMCMAGKKFCLLRIHDDSSFLLESERYHKILKYDRAKIEVYWIEWDESEIQFHITPYYRLCRVKSHILDEKLEAFV